MPTQNESKIIPASSGYNNTDSSNDLPANVAQDIQALLCDRLGRMRSSVAPLTSCDLSTVAGNPNVTVASGLLYYSGSQQVPGTDIYGNPQTIVYPNQVGCDFLLILIASTLYIAQYQKNGYVASLTDVIEYVPQYPYKFQSPVTISDGPNGSFLATPTRLRGAQFGNEMVIVQDNSLTVNFRFYSQCMGTDPFLSSTHLRVLGLPTPPALVLGSTIVYHSPSGGHVARTGKPSYCVVYSDEFGRQSSPSVPVQLDFITNSGDNALIDFTYVNPAGFLTVASIQIYEIVTGNPNLYLIYSQALTTGSNTISYEDGPTGTTDTTIEQGPVGPQFGENDPPNPASIVCQYLDRVLLNDNTNPDILQISNAGSPSQFNSLGYNPVNPNPADGQRASVNSDNSDPIVGLATFGTFAVIAKSKGIYFLYGQNNSNFQIQQVGGVPGCSAKDTFVVCGSTILYLSQVGVLQFDGANAPSISHQISVSLKAYDPLTYSQAQAEYLTLNEGFNFYWLNIGVDNYVYDFGRQDWIYVPYGVDVLEYIYFYYGQNYFDVPNKSKNYSGTVRPLGVPGIPIPSVNPIPLPSTPPFLSYYHSGGEPSNGQTVLGSALTTVSSITVNGSAASTITIYNDTSLLFVVPAMATSGPLIVTNNFGTFETIFVVASPGWGGDYFTRANGAIAGANGWVTQQGTSHYNIVSNQLVCGNPSTGYCTITNTLEHTVNGWIVGQFILSGVGAGMMLVYRSDNAGATWSGYAMEAVYTTGPLLTINLYTVTTGTISSVLDTVTVPIADAPIGQMFQIAVNFSVHTHDVWINGNNITTFTEATFSTNGYGGLRMGGTGQLFDGSRVCLGVILGP